MGRQDRLITPLLSAVVGVVGLVTAAQWAWNAAQLASPTTWIIALVGVVVLLVKHWDKVKAAGGAAWNWIKNAASSSWNFIKKIPGWVGTAFSNVANIITWPFRTAFNVGRSRAHAITRDRDFPAPYQTLAMGSIWLEDDVEEWIRKHRPALAEDPEGE